MSDMSDMSDRELRELCHRFFDAIERTDLRALESIYADDLDFWFNVTGRSIGKTESLAAIESGVKLLRRRSYNDRLVQTFASGFLVQYSLNLVLHDGRRRCLCACLLAECRDGQILRMYEYLDSSKFGIPVGRPRQPDPVPSSRTDRAPQGAPR